MSAAEIERDQAVADLTAHEFDVPCTYHGRHPEGAVPATWAIWLAPRGCGCPSRDYHTVCSECLAYTTHPGRMYRCPYGCGHRAPHRIIRTERLL